MKFKISYLLIFILIIFLLYYLRKHSFLEKYKLQSDNSTITNTLVKIALTDENNNYQSQTLQNNILGIKKQNYTKFDENPYYKDSLVYTGKLSDGLIGEWIITTISDRALNRVIIYNHNFKIFLGYSQSNELVYVTENFTDDCVWSLETDDNVVYTIRHYNSKLYLFNEKTKNSKLFVIQNTTGTYDFGVVSCKSKPFKWLIIADKPVYSGTGTYSEAVRKCKSMGKLVCSKGQIQAASNLGYSKCNCSWLNNYSMSKDSVMKGFPGGKDNSGCNNTGFNNCGYTNVNSTNSRSSGILCCSPIKLLKKIEKGEKYTQLLEFNINLENSYWNMDQQWYNLALRNGIGKRYIWKFFEEMFRGKRIGYQIIGTIKNCRGNGYDMKFMGTQVDKYCCVLKVISSSNGKYAGIIKMIYYIVDYIDLEGESWAIDDQWYTARNGTSIGWRKIWPQIVNWLYKKPKGYKKVGIIKNNPNRSRGSGEGLQILATHMGCLNFKLTIIAGNGDVGKEYTLNIDKIVPKKIYNTWITVPGYGDCRSNLNSRGFGGRNDGDGLYGPWGYHNGTCYNSVNKCKKICNIDGNCVAFSWRPKSKGCTFFCNKESSLCYENGNNKNSLPCYDKTDNKGYAKCYTKPCNTYNTKLCNNQPQYYKLGNQIDLNKGNLSDDECRKKCTLDKNCIGYAFDEKRVCHNYQENSFKTPTKLNNILYSCKPIQGEKNITGYLKSGIPLGCYKNKRSSDLSVYKGNQMDQKKCSELCKKYKYYGQQGKGQCACGNSYGKYGRIESCTPKLASLWRGNMRNMIYKNPSHKLSKFYFWQPVYTSENCKTIRNFGKQSIDSYFRQMGIFKFEIYSPRREVIYYKRISYMAPNFSIYDNMINTWTNRNNLLNRDFKLYSTENDLLNDTNSWKFCNYNDFGGKVGFPRDCGKYGPKGGRWARRPGFGCSSGAKTFNFSIALHNNPDIPGMIPFVPSNSLGECSSINQCKGGSWSLKNRCKGIFQSSGDGGCNQYCGKVGGRYYRGDWAACTGPKKQGEGCTFLTNAFCNNSWNLRTCRKQCIKSGYLCQSHTPGRKSIDLGPVGISPWGNASARFFHPSTRWIWNVPNARVNASQKGIVIFNYNFCVKESMRGRIAINIDNVGNIFINNKFIRRYGGGWAGDTGRFNITLNKGLNNIRVEAENLGREPNPAGIAVTIYDNQNRMLVVSNRNWTWTTRTRP